MDNQETALRIDGSWVLAYDGTGHVLLADGSVLVDRGRIVYVGPQQDAPAAAVVLGGAGRFVFPGLINLHVHASSQVAERLFADAGRPDLQNCGFLNYIPRSEVGGGRSLSAFEDPEVAGKLTLWNLLRSGTTTLVEIGGELGGIENLRRFAELCGELGARAYLGPGYAGATWVYDARDQLGLVWDEAAGLEGLDAATGFIEEHNGTWDDRIRGMLFPLETATSTPRLLGETLARSRQLGVPISIHAAETLVEWNEVTRREGCTPLGYLEREGFLQRHVVLGHAVFTDTHSATAWPGAGDIDRLAAGQATVAHCPLVFARRGFALESFDRYRQAGVRLGMGTDAYPQDLLLEMRIGSLLAKVTDRSFASGQPSDLLDAATLGGADALGRHDLGRLAAGAAGDVAVADLRRLTIGPVLDPVRALVHEATADDLEYVLVGGRIVKNSDGVAGVDLDELCPATDAVARRIWDGFRAYREGSAHASAYASPSYPVVWNLDNKRDPHHGTGMKGVSTS
jgi:cytosine/adenosine deaminase-related metal-dependent hydrolase